MALATKTFSKNLTRVNGEFRPSTIDVNARTIELCATTGQGGRRYDWYDETSYIEELDVTPESMRTERLEKGLSVIDSHMVYQGIGAVFGITEGYRFEDGQLFVTVRFAEDEESEVIYQKVITGILRHVSLGYTVHTYLKTRGDVDEIYTYTAVDWEPTELSFVPVSFENNNGVRSGQRDEEPTYSVEIKEDVIMTEEERKAAELAEKKRLADEAATQQRTLIAQVVKDTLAAERGTVVTPPVTAPVLTITEQRSDLAPMLDAAKKAGLKAEFATRAFTDGKTVAEFRTLVIDELADADSKNIVRNMGVDLISDKRNDANETMLRNYEKGILLRTGAKLKPEDIDQEVRAISQMSMIDVAGDFLTQKGESLRGLSSTRKAQRAFHSTSDFPLILENVMNKNLNAAYQETPQTFRDLGRSTTVSDFRDKHTYSVGDAPSLKPLGENGEYKGGTFSESKESYRISTFARKIGFTRQMLINDDLSALDRMPAMFGAAGSRLESDIVWGLLLNYDFINNKAASHTLSDGKALFHADHKNVLTGPTSAFSQAALSNLRKLGRKMKTLDGNFMNLEYQNIVVPEDIETTVEKVLLGTFTAITEETTNPFTNRLNYRVEPRLSVVSQTAYLAFSNMLESFEYAGLAGEGDMYTEVNTVTDIDGLEIKVRKDFGAGFTDYRGIARGNGA